MSNAVEVTSTQQVLLTQTATNVLELLAPSQVSVVEVSTPGPQGPTGGVSALDDLTNVDAASAVNKSVLYYDSASAHWKGDDINTVLTLTDGGAF